MKRIWSISIGILISINAYAADVVDKEYAKFTLDNEGRTSVRGSYTTLGTSTGTLPAGIQEREAQKFTTDSNGDVAVRMVVPNMTNLDAATVGGYTPEQLTAQNLTYYIWGSVNGPFTNPISRMAQLSSPVGENVRTNTYIGVTNGQFLGGFSVNTNENPRILTKGIVMIDNVLEHTGTNVGTIRGTLYVYEPDQVTVVASFPNGDITECMPGGPHSHALAVSITNDVNIKDFGRVMLLRTRTVAGWDGTQNIIAYSQDGYLSRVTLPGSGGGVYATTAEAAAAVAAYSNVVKGVGLGAEGMRVVGGPGGYRLDEFFQATSIRGASRDYPLFTYALSPVSNLVVSWTSGDVYSPEDGYFHLTPDSTTLTDNSVNYAYWNATTPTQVKFTTTRPAVDSNIVIAVFVTAFGQITDFDGPEAAGDFPLNTRAGAARLAPSLINYGMTYSAVATNLNAIVMAAGEEYHDMRIPKEYATLDLRTTNVLGIATYGHTNAGVWGVVITNKFPIGKWDSGSAIAACTATSTNWYKGLFLAQSGSKYMHYVYPQVTYTSEVDAISGVDPSVPPGFTPYVPMCTEYVFCGTDTVLRISATDWVDRRFQIRRPGTAVVSGGSAPTPSLDLVMLAGSSLGGILPQNAGLPTLSHQLTSKAYVDSTINNINAHRAYVDGLSGSNETAKLASSILPYKTIQAAINAAAAVASDSNRYVIELSPGTYTENVTMSNYVSLRGVDIESTRIIGSAAFPKQFTDTFGAELALLSVVASNTPALVLNSGSDNGYMGARSCNFVSTYYNGQTNKSVALIYRGLPALYATCYFELDVTPTNGSGSVRNAQIFEHTTDPDNPGLSQFTAFSGSCLINCTDTNDDISLIYTHDNTDATCINNVMGTLVNMHLDGPGVYTNTVKIVNHKNAQGRTLSQGTVCRVYLGLTNNVNVHLGYADGGTADNVAIVRGNHIRMPTGSTSNVWLGAATGVNDSLRVYDSVYIQNFSDHPYPKIYTNAGAAGKFFVNTVMENGDQLFGSAVDMSVVNSGTISTPAVGHLKLYASPYAGIEDMYLKDSSGNTLRGFRDNFYRGFNDTATPMMPGEAVYISSGLSSSSTPKFKRSISSDPSTMPAIGVIAHNGGIATGAVGRVMYFGRMETPMNTSAFTPGDKLYVSATVAGGLTNVAPTGDNIAQLIGTCHVSATNGYVNVRPWGPDTLGGLTPQHYALSNRTGVWDAASITALAASNIAVTASNKAYDIAGNTNTYLAGYNIAIAVSNYAVAASITNGILSAANTFTTNALTNTTLIAVSVSNWMVSVSSGVATALQPVSTQGLVTASVTNGILASANTFTTNALTNTTLIAVAASNKVFDIAGNTNSYQTAYTWSTNDAIQDTNVAQAVMALYPTGSWNGAVITANAASNIATFASNGVMTIIAPKVYRNIPTNTVAGTETTVWTVTNAPFAAPYTNVTVALVGDIDSSANGRSPILRLYTVYPAGTTNQLLSLIQYIQTGGTYGTRQATDYLYNVTNNVVYIVTQQQTGGNGNSLSRNLHLFIRPE